MRYFFCMIVLLLLPGFLSGQTLQEYSSVDTLLAEGDSLCMDIENDVVQDARIDSLLKLHLQLNRKENAAEGFRLQLFSASGHGARERAEAIKADFLAGYPDYNAYVVFQSPDWKVRVGDFRNKSGTLKLKKMIEKKHPNAFIVPDKINFPKLDE